MSHCCLLYQNQAIFLTEFNEWQEVRLAALYKKCHKFYRKCHEFDTNDMIMI